MNIAQILLQRVAEMGDAAAIVESRPAIGVLTQICDRMGAVGT